MDEGRLKQLRAALKTSHYKDMFDVAIENAKLQKELEYTKEKLEILKESNKEVEKYRIEKCLGIFLIISLSIILLWTNIGEIKDITKIENKNTSTTNQINKSIMEPKDLVKEVNKSNNKINQRDNNII